MKKKPVWWVILVALAILAVFIFVFWISQQTVQAPTEDLDVGTDNEVLPEDLDGGVEVSTSDEISAIESDLNSTDLGSLDAELDNINSEIQ